MARCESTEETTEERIVYWKNILKNEEIEEGIEETLLNDLQIVIDRNDNVASIDLLNLLINSLPLIECPSMALDPIIHLVRLCTPISARAFKGLMLLYTEYSVSIPEIYTMLYDLISEEICKTEIDLLMILVNDLLYSDGLSVQIVRAFLKRLSYMSIRVHISIAHKILNVLSVISHKHKNSIVKVPKSRTSHKELIKPLSKPHTTHSTLLSNTTGVDTPNKPYHTTTPINDTTVDYYLYELDVLKDHPILSTYIREIKQNKIVNIREEEINRRVLELL